MEKLLRLIPEKVDIIFDGDGRPICSRQAIQNLLNESVVYGRVSVLRDFDAICAADAFVGFNEQEWATIKRFFEFNKVVSGWDK